MSCAGDGSAGRAAGSAPGSWWGFRPWAPPAMAATLRRPLPLAPTEASARACHRAASAAQARSSGSRLRRNANPPASTPITTVSSTTMATILILRPCPAFPDAGAPAVAGSTRRRSRTGLLDISPPSFGPEVGAAPIHLLGHLEGQDLVADPRRVGRLAQVPRSDPDLRIDGPSSGLVPRLERPDERDVSPADGADGARPALERRGGAGEERPVLRGERDVRNVGLIDRAVEHDIPGVRMAARDRLDHVRAVRRNRDDDASAPRRRWLSRRLASAACSACWRS